MRESNGHEDSNNDAKSSRAEIESRSFTEAYLQTLAGVVQAGRDLAKVVGLMFVMTWWSMLPLVVAAGLEILDVVEWTGWQTGTVGLVTALWFGLIGVPTTGAALEVMGFE